MTELKKKRIKTVLKYSWPFYLVLALVVFGGMGFIYRVAHPLPAYKSLTIFVSGGLTDVQKLKEDMLDKYQDKEIKSFSCIASEPNDSHYRTKLTVAGYSRADVLILPTSKLTNTNPGTFSINLSDDLVNSFYQGYTFYLNEGVKYGIQIDKEKVKQYMTLPNEDCYMFLNGRSKNLGDYSLTKPVTEHDVALHVAKDWGM